MIKPSIFLILAVVGIGTGALLRNRDAGCEVCKVTSQLLVPHARSKHTQPSDPNPKLLLLEF